MKYLLRPIFELMTEKFTLLGDNILYNYLAMALIGLFSYVIAYKIVGRMYNSGAISGGHAGSVLHWIIRAVIFVALFYAFASIIWLIKFAQSIPLWGWYTVVVIAVMTIIIIVGLKIRKRLWLGATRECN